MLKTLIANRSEIAVRIIRTARELGLLTVAVYSDADERSLHCQMADEAVWIGGSAPDESYLCIEKLIEAAKRTGCDSIHPGYGFLSERPEFADACDAAGIRFLGPSGAAIRSIGSKSAARKWAVQVGVPTLAGSSEMTDADLEIAANSLGFPVLLKAAAGGGGRGMREVHSAQEFRELLAVARQEAERAFGDGAMLVERLLMRAKHVEIQFLADSQGTVAFLFERECSIQRRHQKLIEEAPSPAVERHQSLWPEMRECACKLIQSVRYVGAGTVEFLLDEPNGAFYFLEVNARLQVEHPISEAITGVDIVRMQYEIASGQAINQHLLKRLAPREAIIGHAIEVRIIAEDPANGFRASTGKLLRLQMPTGPGIRVDSGFRSGDEITPYYDSLIAKLIVHAPDRKQAMSKLRVALENTHVLGVTTNIGFLIDVMSQNEFQSGDYDTKWLERDLASWQVSATGAPLVELAETATAQTHGSGARNTLNPRNTQSAWALSDGYSNVRAKTKP